MAGGRCCDRRMHVEGMNHLDFRRQSLIFPRFLFPRVNGAHGGRLLPTPRTVEFFVMSDESHKKPESDKIYVRKQRKCLRCQEAFTSSWPGERVCTPCKSSSAPPIHAPQAGTRSSATTIVDPGNTAR